MGHDNVWVMIGCVDDGCGDDGVWGWSGNIMCGDHTPSHWRRKDSARNLQAE